MTWNVAGKRVLITGATSGIGLEASVQLARMGARIVMVGRDPSKTAAKQAEIQERGGSKEVEYLLCDFASQAQVRELAAQVRSRYPGIDVLVNNAGGVQKARRLTADGVESTFAVNHLGSFLFTNLILDLVVKSAPSRIVTVASVAHRQGTMEFSDLGFEHGYSIMRGYARSKLANVLFASELARRLLGKGVTSNSIHPGSVATNIWSGAPAWSKPLIFIAMRPFFTTAAQGGETIVNLVAGAEFESVSGEYFEEKKRVAPSPLAQDPAVAKKLWDVSADLVHLQAAT